MPDERQPIPRCPKCKSTSFTAYVTDEQELGAKIVAGKAIESWMPSALPDRISSRGECRCGHTWRFKDKWAIE